MKFIPAPGILWREAAGGRVPSGGPSVPVGHLYRGWPKLSLPRKPTQWRARTHFKHITCRPTWAHRARWARTFSSVGMVSLSLAIRLDTCSMPKLRNSSLPTTSVKCCSAMKKTLWVRMNFRYFLNISINLTCSHSASSTGPYPPGHTQTHFNRATEAVLSHTHTQIIARTNLRSCWPAWGAESRRGGRRRLVFPGSWMDEAESSGTHNKPFLPRSAGAGLLLAATPVKHTHRENPA